MHADAILSWTILSLVSFALSCVGVWLVIRRFSQHFIDVPNQRSSHTRPTPRGGGIAFVAAFFLTAGIAAACLAEGVTSDRDIAGILMVLVPLWVVGAADDARGISVGVRFSVQLAAAGAAVFFFGSFPGLETLLPGVTPAWFAMLLSVIAIAALINFYNFMDGLDGIVGGTAAVQLAFFAWYLLEPGWWPLVASLLGFLIWNWPPAKIFMGDSGSTVLGGAVALALLEAPSPSTMWWAGAVTAPLLGDAVFTLLRRLLRRENVFEAHKTHIYQRLHQSGWSHRRVAGTYVGMTVAIALLVALWT